MVAAAAAMALPAVFSVQYVSLSLQVKFLFSGVRCSGAAVDSQFEQAVGLLSHVVSMLEKQTN